jgi:hypothetical protein
VTHEALLEAVREACPRGLWSQGVTLAREGAVTRERGDGGEIVLRVAARGTAIAPTVVLYPGDGEWDCDCGGRFDACAHVAAAVIAVSQDQLDAAPAAELRYRFERARGRLALRRTVLAPGQPERDLLSSLMSIASGRARAPAMTGLRPTQADLEIDRMLNGAARSVIATELAGPLLSALAGCDRIALDGQPVAASGEPILPRGALTDHADGVRLAVVADPVVDEIAGDGVALCRGVLHPLGHTQVAGASARPAGAGRRFRSSATTPPRSWASSSPRCCPRFAATWRSRCAAGACPAPRAWPARASSST